jgi:hypothetical protein
MLFPLLLSVITYEVTGDPPFSVPTSGVHEIVADPIPATAVGFSTALGKVVGVARSESADHGPASAS